MKHYTDSLSLGHDPFAPAAKTVTFFGVAGRDDLLSRLVEQAHYGAPISAVCGPLGAGKSTLALEFKKSFGEEAHCVSVQSTLFMNQSQFLEAMLEQLPFGASSPEPMDIVEDICHFAEKLYLDAKTLILIVDDAHELASEVLEVFETLVTKVSEGAVHVLLLGETQLSNLLHNALSAELVGRLLEESLQPLGNEDAIQYIEQKLECAGYQGPSLLDNSTIGILVNETNGLPGAMNSRIAEAIAVSIMKADAPVAPIPRDDSMPWPSLGKQYWITAGALSLLLFSALLLPTSEHETQGAEPVDVAIDSQRIEIPLGSQATPTSDEPEIVPEEQLASAQPQSTAMVLDAGEPLVSENAGEEAALTESLKDAATEAAVNDVQVAEAEEVDNVSDAIAAVIKEIEQNSTANSNVSTESLGSEFEQTLLSYPAENFTVQIMGSRSEDNVKRFVSRELGALNRGYFETRYQEQPWFVVVMGNFVSREAATRALGDLPGEIRELNPWIRSLTDVQSDIRQMRGLN